MKLIDWPRNIFIVLFVVVVAPIQAQTVLIDPNAGGGFELGSSFGANGWTLVNSSLNTWRSSNVPIPYSGSRAAFISADGGSSYVYNTGVSQTSHFYRDVTVPAGENFIELSFYYKNQSVDSGFDRILVYTAPTFVFPEVNEPISDATEIADAQLIYEGVNSNDYTQVNLILNPSLAGNNFRLIFTWQNDNADGSGIPAAIDNISLISQQASFGGPLTGIYSINNLLPTSQLLPQPGSNFNNIADAIDYLNLYGINGSVRFELAEGQTFNHTPLTLTYSGTAQDTIAFVGIGQIKPIIQFSGGVGATDAGLTLSGTDYITLQNIEFKANQNPVNQNDNIEYLVRLLNASATDGAQFNCIQNCSFVHNKLFVQNISLLQNVSITPSQPSGTNSFNKIIGNSFNSTVNAIRINSNATQRDNQTRIEDCVFGNAQPNSIGLTASNGGAYVVYVLNASDVIVKNCQLQNVTTNGTVDGIWLAGVSGINEVSGNQIRNLSNSLAATTTGNVVSGIRCVLANNSEARIFNNFISDLNTSSTQTTGAIMVKGISIQPTGTVSNSTFHVDFNSISIDGSDNPAVSYTCAEVIQAGARVNFRNNIFANFTSAQSGSNKHLALQIPNLSIAASGSISDHNDFFIQEPTNGVAVRVGTTEYATLANWQSASVHDDYSLSIDPQFINIHSDLHTVSEGLAGAGTFSGITWVNTDFDGELRATPPFIGADEIIEVIQDLAVVAFVSPDNIGCFTPNEQVSIRIQNLGNQELDFTVQPVDIVLEVSGAITEIVNLTISDMTLNGGQPLQPLSFMNIPIGQLDMTFYGEYNFVASITLTDDILQENDSLELILTNRFPFEFPEMVGFDGFNGSNLETVYPNWYEATGSTNPQIGNSAWTFSQGVDFPANITASFNYNSGFQDSWIISKKIIPSSLSFLSFDLAITDAFSNAGSGEFGDDDVFRIMISNDCGFTFSIFDEYTFGSIIPNVLTNFQLPLHDFSGQEIQIAFFASDGLANQVPFNLHLDNLHIYNSSDKKIEFIELISPQQKLCYSPEESMIAIIKNTGFSDIDFEESPLDLKLKIQFENVESIFETSISSGVFQSTQELEVSFGSDFDMTEPGEYRFTLSLAFQEAELTLSDSLILILYGQNPKVNLVENGVKCFGNELEVIADVLISGIFADSILNFKYEGDPINIPDNQISGVEIPISVVGAANPASRLFSVRIDSVTHEDLSQLSFQLVAPDGSTIILTQFNSGVESYFLNTEFSMSTSNLINHFTEPYTGVFLPLESFVNFSGNSDGTWYLRVIDLVPGSQGMLHKWSISFYAKNDLLSYEWETENNILMESDSELYAVLTSTADVIYLLSDLNGCRTLATLQTLFDSFLSASVTVSQIECEGCLATISIMASGGVEPYAGIGIFEIAEPGLYSYTVNDANGCDTTLNVVVESIVGFFDEKSNCINVFPNPFSSHFEVFFKAPFELIDLILLDQSGRMIQFESNVLTDRIIISIDGLQDGVYYLGLNNSNGKHIVKVVKI
jgi:subtilisin-like proprotein convertase family protein